MKKLTALLIAAFLLGFVFASCSGNGDPANTGTAASEAGGGSSSSGGESSDPDTESLPAESSPGVSDDPNSQDKSTDESIATSGAASGDVSSDSSEEPSQSQPPVSEPQPPVSEPQPPVSEPQPPVSEPSSEEPSEEERKLSDLSAAELWDFAFGEQAKLGSFTVSTNNKMTFTYAGQTGSYLYTDLLKVQSLSGSSPLFLSNAATTLDGESVTSSEAFSNGYYYFSIDGEKTKVAMTAAQFKKRFEDTIPGGKKPAVTGFNSLKKTQNGTGWIITGSGLKNSSANKFFEDLIASMNLNLTVKEINLKSFTHSVYVDSTGGITKRETKAAFDYVYSGVTIGFNITMSSVYTDKNSTKVTLNINPNDYTLKTGVVS
ncbi:MAG: hypothetical protein WCR95_00875 [Eubacteriales bacterium]